MNINNQCPSCGKALKKGFIQSGTRLAWVPKVSKASVEPSLNKDAVLLSKQNRFSINFVDAYICEDCEKVVIDYATYKD